MAWRRSFLIGLLAAAAAVIVGIEILSRLDAIGRMSLTLLGATAAAIFAAILIRRARRSDAAHSPTHFDRALIAALVVSAACTLVVALCAPPNHWDAMTYHMARVAEWYDHGTVAFYPTPIDRQLWQPPFAEYLILVSYGLLGGTDYLANLPQWIAFAGAAVAAMEIARLLGASRSMQLAAALVVM